MHDKRPFDGRLVQDIDTHPWDQEYHRRSSAFNPVYVLAT